jgi:hypothetical protein
MIEVASPIIWRRSAAARSGSIEGVVVSGDVAGGSGSCTLRILRESGGHDDDQAADDDEPVAAGADRPGGEGALIDLAGERLGDQGPLVGPELPVLAAAEGDELERETEEALDLGDADRDRGPGDLVAGIRNGAVDGTVSELDRRHVRHDEPRRRGVPVGSTYSPLRARARARISSRGVIERVRRPA